jgi:hypothetical protein
MLLYIVARKLLLSSCVIMWATLASAEGDAKLALTAMVRLAKLSQRVVKMKREGREGEIGGTARRIVD